MSAFTSLITAQEVIDSTPRSQGADVNLVKPFIIMKEEDLFRVWLGLDWYEDLKLNLADNSSFVYFQEGTDYSFGTTVLWRDVLYTSLAQTGGALPSDSSIWAKTGKFQSSDNNYLWDRYLKTVIAWHIQQETLVYNAIKQTAVTVGTVSGNKLTAVSDKTLASFKHTIGQDFNSFLLTMDQYLRDNSATFPLYRGNKLGLDENNLTRVGRPRRNYGFTGME